MNTKILAHGVASVFLSVSASIGVADDRLSIELFQQVLDKRLQQLRSAGFTVRTVLFEKVLAGTPADGRYPFQVLAIIASF